MYQQFGEASTGLRPWAENKLDVVCATNVRHDMITKIPGFIWVWNFQVMFVNL